MKKASFTGWDSMFTFLGLLPGEELQEFYALVDSYEAGPYMMCMIYEHPGNINTYVDQAIRSDDIGEITDLVRRCFDEGMDALITNSHDRSYVDRMLKALTEQDCNIKALWTLLRSNETMLAWVIDTMAHTFVELGHVMSRNKNIVGFDYKKWMRDGVNMAKTTANFDDMEWMRDGVNTVKATVDTAFKKIEEFYEGWHGNKTSFTGWDSIFSFLAMLTSKELQDFYELVDEYRYFYGMSAYYEHPGFISSYSEEALFSVDIEEIIDLMARCFDEAINAIVTNDDEFNYVKNVHEALTDRKRNIKAIRSLMHSDETMLEKLLDAMAHTFTELDSTMRHNKRIDVDFDYMQWLHNGVNTAKAKTGTSW